MFRPEQEPANREFAYESSMRHFHLQPKRLENRERQTPLPELSTGAFASKRETGSDYPEDPPPSADGAERSRAYVTLLKLFSIASGCLDTLYRPDNATTRGQMGVFIIRSIVGPKECAN